MMAAVSSRTRMADRKPFAFQVQLNLLSTGQVDFWTVKAAAAAKVTIVAEDGDGALVDAILCMPSKRS